MLWRVPQAERFRPGANLGLRPKPHRQQVILPPWVAGLSGPCGRSWVIHFGDISRWCLPQSPVISVHSTGRKNGISMSGGKFRQRVHDERESDKAHARLMELEEQKFRNSTRLETFKTINGISLFGIRFLMILNGGAAAAVVSFASKITAAPANGQSLSKNLQVAVGCYVVGLVLSAVALMLGWLSQIKLFQQWSGSASKEAAPTDTRWLFVMMIGFGFLSIGLFLLGSLEAIGVEMFARAVGGSASKTHHIATLSGS